MGKELTGYPSIDKPWLKYYKEEAVNANLPEQSIYGYMWENNKDHPKDIALVYFGRKITYWEMFRQIDQCAQSLTSLGVVPGDIVTVALPSIPETLYIVYAVNKIGAVANMIHPLAGESETLFYLKEVGSKIAFLFEETYQDVRESIHTTNVEKAILVSAGDSLPFVVRHLFRLKNAAPKISGQEIFLNWRDFISCGKSNVCEEYPRDINKPAIISHTGGTTGEPKGVMCSDRNINALIWQVGCNLDFKRQDRCLVVLPPFINYSLVDSMLASLVFGFQTVLIPDYHADRFDEYVKKYHPNHISSIPDYWEALLSNERLKTMDLSCLDYLFYGGEAMSIAKEEEVNSFLRSHGARRGLGAGMGATEMVSAATFTYESCRELGSVGIPLVKVNCKIVEPETFRELSYGQVGEICFSGETMMLGYYQKPEATNEVIKIHPDKQKWLHTGDLGQLNENGVLFITGRIKRILPTMGPNAQPTKMFPDRIEKVVMKHEAVDLCCVIGIPDPVRTYYPRAYVVLNRGYRESEQLTEELRRLCMDSLPSYMIPEEIMYCDDLPRTERGKVDYRALEQMDRV